MSSYNVHDYHRNRNRGSVKGGGFVHSIGTGMVVEWIAYELHKSPQSSFTMNVD